LEIAHRAAEKVGPVRKVIVARIAQEEKIAHRAWGALMRNTSRKSAALLDHASFIRLDVPQDGANS
jgi:hypothetical protein